MGLGGVFHDKKTAALQQDGDLVLCPLVLEAEFPFSPKTDGGDGAVFAEGFLIIAVPGHAFVAIVIEVEQAGIEDSLGESLNHGLQLGEFRRPWQGFFGGAGIGVGETRVAIPCNFPRSDDVLAEDDSFVVFPRNFA